MNRLLVMPVGDHRTVRYAATELAAYLERLTRERVGVRPVDRYDATVPGIYVGPAEAFGDTGTPAVADARFDDAICVEVQGRSGIVTGSNPRSVLLAAYRYLGELGVRWVRPGPEGESVPSGPREDLSASITEAASYRHRGICIEGAVSYEHVRDLIEWMPRVGFNAFFLEFMEAFTFFDRWYSANGNPLRRKEPFTVEDARAIVRRIVGDMGLRDMLYHAVGHGWTCEPFGIAGLGWDRDPTPAPPEAVPFLAEVDGRREIWDGVPLNTNLCYSNPEARRRIVAHIVQYVEQNPAVDLLHLWLADGFNNHCECAECRKALPADFYVMLLNEVDEALTAAGRDTRVVFLIYCDLLWPPVTERLRNPDRFVLMFAPITRTYSRPFSPDGPDAHMVPYERNRLELPRSVEGNVAYLRAWQEMGASDGFDYDYHFMWDQYRDPGFMRMAAVLHSDIRLLRGIGLNGLVSDQSQRTHFPNGMPMTVMGRTLWDASLELDDIVDDYFQAAFGDDWQACRAYMTTLSDLFDPVYLRNEKPAVSEESAVAFASIPSVIGAFRGTIAANEAACDPCRAASWRFLAHHADLCVLLAAALEERARGQQAAAWDRWQLVAQCAREREHVLHPMLDVFEYLGSLEGLFRIPASA